MPFKDAERARQWNRAYQRRRDARARAGRRVLEHRILRLVLAEPRRHTEFTLYAHFHKGGIPLAAITRVVRILTKGGMLSWALVKGPNLADNLDFTRRLDLTDQARALFTPPAGRPEEDRADDREGRGKKP